nr:hypothetical protein [Bacteroidota bacterium]
MISKWLGNPSLLILANRWLQAVKDYEMKIKQSLLLISFIGLYTSLSFGQDGNYPNQKFEIGLNIFTYQGNLIAPKRNYVDKFVPHYFNGGLIKFHKNKIKFRIGYDYFKYHLRYVLSEITEVADYDRSEDGIFNRHKLYFGIEKEILRSRVRPFIFADLGFYYSRYHGDLAEFSGWSLDEYFGV